MGFLAWKYLEEHPIETVYVGDGSGRLPVTAVPMRRYRRALVLVMFAVVVALWLFARAWSTCGRPGWV